MSLFSSFMRFLGKAWRKPRLVVSLSLVALITLAGSLDYNLPRDFIEPRLRKALQRDTGYVIESIKSASFSALPWPSIRIAQLELVKPDQTQERVSIPVVKARLNLAAWVSGNPRITSLTLLRPQLSLAGDVNVTETEAMSATVFHELQRHRRPQLSSVRVIEGGVIRGSQPWISNLNLNVLNHVGHDMRVRANASVRGVPFRMTSDINQTEGHSRRPIAWTLATSAGDISFSGLLMGPKSLDAEGAFAITVKDLGPMADRLGLNRDYVPLLNGMRIAGETRLSLPSLQIREAHITRGDERMTGSVEVNLGTARPSISATLHTAKFDLQPAAMPFLSPLTTSTGSWSVTMLPY